MNNENNRSDAEYQPPVECRSYDYGIVNEALSAVDNLRKSGYLDIEEYRLPIEKLAKLCELDQEKLFREFDWRVRAWDNLHSQKEALIDKGAWNTAERTWFNTQKKKWRTETKEWHAMIKVHVDEYIKLKCRRHWIWALTRCAVIFCALLGITSPDIAYGLDRLHEQMKSKELPDKKMYQKGSRIWATHYEFDLYALKHIDSNEGFNRLECLDKLSIDAANIESLLCSKREKLTEKDCYYSTDCIIDSAKTIAHRSSDGKVRGVTIRPEYLGYKTTPCICNKWKLDKCFNLKQPSEKRGLLNRFDSGIVDWLQLAEDSARKLIDESKCFLLEGLSSTDFLEEGGLDELPAWSFRVPKRNEMIQNLFCINASTHSEYVEKYYPKRNKLVAAFIREGQENAVASEFIQTQKQQKVFGRNRYKQVEE